MPELVREEEWMWHCKKCDRSFGHDKKKCIEHEKTCDFHW